jgi:hypothetical protein
MTQTSMRAFLQEILAWILICALLTTPGLAQEAASQGQSPGQAGPGGANNPEVQLATEVQAKIEEQRRLNLAKLRERARALEGPTVIGDVAFAQQTLAGLVLVRDVYIQQLRTFINQATQWKTLTRRQKREVIRALDQYNANYIVTGSVAPPSNRTWKCDAETQAYLRLASEFQPLFSVGPPGMFSSTFSEVLLKSSRTDPDRLVETFDQYLEYGIQGSRDEIWRVQPINTVAGISEFLAPQYQNTWAAAANLYGKSTRDLISTLPEFASTYMAVRHEQRNIKRLKMAAVVGTICIVAMAAAPVAYLAGGQALLATGNAVGSAINLGVTAVQLGYDGAEFYGVYNQMSNTQRGGGATEANPSGLQVQAYMAGAGMALDGFFVGMAAKDFKNAVQGLKVVPGTAGSPGNLAPVASPGGNTATAPTAGIITADGAATPGAVRGIEKASSLGIPQPEIDRALQLMRPAGANPETFVTDIGVANLIGKRFEGIDQLGALEKEALQAGVPQRAIQSAFARARSATSDQLAMFGVKLPAALRTLTAQAKGAKVVVDRAEIAEYVELTGLPANAVIQADVTSLMITSAKLSLMRMGRRSRWSAEDIRLLRRLRSFPNRANLYAFTDLEEGETSLVRLFNEEQLQTADQFFNSVNRQAIARGEAMLPQVAQRAGANTLPLFPPTELANPVTGEWITSGEVSALSSAQLQRLSPEVVRSLNDGALKTALTDRLLAEAAKINANPAVCPPPQIGPAQLSWATHTLFVLGGGVPNAPVGQLQPQDGDFVGAPPTGNSPGGAGGPPAGSNASNEAPRNDGIPQTPIQPSNNPGGSGNVPYRPSDPGRPSATVNDTQSSTSPGTSAPSKDVPPPSRHQLYEESSATPVPQRGGEQREAKPDKLYDDNKSPQTTPAGTPNGPVGAPGGQVGQPKAQAAPPGQTPGESSAANPPARPNGANPQDGPNATPVPATGANQGAGNSVATPTPSLPSCKKSDDECAPLREDYIKKQYATVLAEQNLPQANKDTLEAAEAESQAAQAKTMAAYWENEADYYGEQASHYGWDRNNQLEVRPQATREDFGATAAQFKKLQAEAKGKKEQYEKEEGDLNTRAANRKAEAARIKATIEAAKEAEAAALKALTDCLHRPPCPGYTPGATPTGTTNGTGSGGDKLEIPAGVGARIEQATAAANSAVGNATPGGSSASSSKTSPQQSPQGKNSGGSDSKPAGASESGSKNTQGGSSSNTGSSAGNQPVKDIPLPPGGMPDLTSGSNTIYVKGMDTGWKPGDHHYTDPETGEESWLNGDGPTNPPGEPIGWWGLNPKTGQVTWHPRQFPPPPPPGKWEADSHGVYHYIPAIQMPPNSSRQIRLRVENKCSSPEKFRIETEGLPANLVQPGEEISIAANDTKPFLLTINTYGLEQGKYDGNLVVVCTSCATSACRQLRGVFPQQFFLTQDPSSGVPRQPVNSSGRTQSDGMGSSAPNPPTEGTTQQNLGAEDSAQPAAESPL